MAGSTLAASAMHISFGNCTEPSTIQPLQSRCNPFFFGFSGPQNARFPTRGHLRSQYGSWRSNGVLLLSVTEPPLSGGPPDRVPGARIPPCASRPPPADAWRSRRERAASPPCAHANSAKSMARETCPAMLIMTSSPAPTRRVLRPGCGGYRAVCCRSQRSSASNRIRPVS